MDNPIIYCKNGNHKWGWQTLQHDKQKVFHPVYIPEHRDDANFEATCPKHYNFEERVDGLYIVRKFVTTNSQGIHARPAAEITKISALEKGILMSVNGKKVRADSIMEILTLEIYQGTEFYIFFPETIPRKSIEMISLGVYHAAVTELH